MYSCFQNNPFATLLIGVYGFLYGLSRFYKNTVGRKAFLICLLKLRLLLVSGIYRNLYKEMFLPEHWEAELWPVVRKPTDDFGRVCCFIAFSVYGSNRPLVFL